MVFKLDTLDVMLDFAHGPYRLGDTINATVTLIPNSDIEIRTASLSLVAEARRTEVKMGREMGMGGAATLQGGVPLRTNDYVPMQQTTEQKISTETCYSTQFMNSESLSKDNVSRRKVDLTIGPHLPKVALEAEELQRDANSSLSIEQWWLEVQVDVVRGRDSMVREEINVKLT